MSNKLSDKVLGHLKNEIVTWLGLCKLDKDLQLITCSFFSFKDLAELKIACPKAASVRGRVFYNAKYLTENLLAQLFNSIQGGLAELINSNCKEQITLILQEIMNKDQDVFSDITNSKPDTTIFDQID